MLLMNKMPLRRILETADIAPQTLYRKIDFLHSQAMLFAADQERRLPQLPIRRLYLACDRQDHLVNWSRRTDRRPVQFTAVGTADQQTGYVFGMHLNFDGSIDFSDPEIARIAEEDQDLPTAHRRLARLWLPAEDDGPAAAEAARQIAVLPERGLLASVRRTYKQVELRTDVEAPVDLSPERALPARGAQIHSEYTLFAHFQILRRMIGHTEKIRFFLDLDSGMRGACLSAFQGEIRAGKCEAFYVRINKDLTQDRKQAAVGEAKAAFEMALLADPDLRTAAVADRLSPEAELQALSVSDDPGARRFFHELMARTRTRLLMERRRQAVAIGSWNDRWVSHPLPSMSEPEKALCWLTDRGHLEEEHIASLMNLASLHAIDRFFMQGRRRLKMAERPIATASRARRIWHGYSPYDPSMLAKALDIYRVYYNFVKPGEDKRTPAQRLGLCDVAASVDEIISLT